MLIFSSSDNSNESVLDISRPAPPIFPLQDENHPPNTHGLQSYQISSFQYVDEPHYLNSYNYSPAQFYNQSQGDVSCCVYPDGLLNEQHAIPEFSPNSQPLKTSTENYFYYPPNNHYYQMCTDDSMYNSFSNNSSQFQNQLELSHNLGSSFHTDSNDSGFLSASPRFSSTEDSNIEYKKFSKKHVIF